MNRQAGIITAVAVAAVALAGLLLLGQAARQPQAPPRSAFAKQVDLSPLGRIAVHDEGRLKSFDSFASTMMHYVSGPRAINGESDSFSYLDLMLRPGAYEDADIIYVKNKALRGEIAAALQRSPDPTRQDLEQRRRGFRKTGLISERLLSDSQVQSLLQRKEQDLIRTAKSVQQIQSAITVKHPEVLRESLRIVPPPGGDFHDPWTTAGAFLSRGGEGSDADLSEELSGAWSAFTGGWRNRNAHQVNTAAIELAALLPRINPELYPDQGRLGWESWYFKTNNMTWVWLVYLLSVVFLVMSLVYRWAPARWIGLGTFIVAFGLHTFALLLRWYVSSRWPNSNMFEAVTTSVWFGGCLALILEVLVRRSPMRNLFALGSAVASMVALMCVNFLPVQLNPNITNRMPVLHDVWLYIHTNVIIFSYGLITMAAVSALIYLLYRLGGGKADYVRVGGAGALILRRPTGESYLTEAKSSPGQVFDGATMVLMELAFIMLWAGLVMGAIWADHSWGRPWGWDPKEVFALNTFIILALLVHTRLKVTDKGLWTALLAMLGFVVMLFNWIFINFYIVGLHSYA
jgi:cytochrome c-type biogenesis protein CcsB